MVMYRDRKPGESQQRTRMPQSEVAAVRTTHYFFKTNLRMAAWYLGLRTRFGCLQQPRGCWKCHAFSVYKEKRLEMVWNRLVHH